MCRGSKEQCWERGEEKGAGIDKAETNVATAVVEEKEHYEYDLKENVVIESWTLITFECK